MLANPLNPVEAGLLVPDVVEEPCRVRKRKRLSDRSGSFTMQNLKGMHQEAQTEEERIESEKRQRREARAVQRSAALEAAAALNVSFTVCEFSCACGREPCPFRGWKRCPQCGPKKSICRRAKCVELRQTAESPHTTDPRMLLTAHIPPEAETAYESDVSSTSSDSES